MNELMASFVELMVPLQRGKYFSAGDKAFAEELFALISTVSGLKYPTEEFRLTTCPTHPLEEQASNPLNLKFLKLLIMLRPYSNILEIGSFIGLSAINFASVLPRGGKVTTIEKFDTFAALARKNIADNGFSGKVELIQGDAFSILEDMDPARKFDFIFLDGNKERYQEYFEVLDIRLQPGGLMVVDDVIFEGDTLNNPPQTEKARGIKKMLETAAGRRDYYRLLLPIGNGMLLMFKIDNSCGGEITK